MEPVHAQSGRAALETEDALHLMPDGEHEEDRQPDEHGEGDDETEPRARLFTLSSQLRVPPRAVVVVGAVDRFRVDGRLLGRGDHAAGWLGHLLESSAGHFSGL